MENQNTLTWDDLRGKAIHMVGIKGNGMAALAAALHGEGARVSGSDTGEVYFTDAILDRMGVKARVGFSPDHLPSDTHLVIHSPAYDRRQNPELARAAELGLPVLSYPESLGEISRQFASAAVSGSHGKTTTTAMAAVLARALGLGATVVVPSGVVDLDGLPVYRGGRDCFVAETCEYRRHFLSYRPRWIVMTNVEAEHLDYYRDWDDVCSAFESFARLLPPGGVLIYNADDPGCRRVAAELEGGTTVMVPVGTAATGEYRMVGVRAEEGRVTFRLAALDRDLELTVPGLHNAHNAAQALALVCAMAGKPLGRLDPADREAIGQTLRGYRGCKRRAERVGEVNGITILDDYGHHPTEIRTTLQGLRSFYGRRRLVVDFMPHTFSRTRALFQDFVTCFDAADHVVLHKVFPSARERDDGSATGQSLARAVGARRGGVRYFDEPLEALGHLRDTLRPGDVFVTMGAGDNGKLGPALIECLGVSAAANRGTP